jgi:hypothetical protein
VDGGIEGSAYFRTEELITTTTMIHTPVLKEPDIWGLKQRINDLAGMILQGAVFQGDFHHFSGPVSHGFRSKAAALVYGAPLPAFKGREAQGGAGKPQLRCPRPNPV